MQNEPNFSKSQMFITIAITTNYSEKCKLDTWSKRTQTKPILSAAGGKLAGEELEFFDAQGVPQFLQSNQLELTYSFLGQAQVLADLLQGLFLFSYQ